MPFTIPDVAAAWNPIQAGVQSGDLQMMTDAIAGDGLVSGCAVTAQTVPDMTVAVASGNLRIGGSAVAVTSGNVTITANATGNPRLDLICVNSSGTKSAQAGTAAAAPKYPTIPGSSVVLAAVLVPTGATSITSDSIVDKRIDITHTHDGSEITTGTIVAARLPFIKVTETYDPPSMINGESITHNVTVTGAASGDPVIGIGHSAIGNNGWVLNGQASTDLVSIKITNGTGGTVNLNTGTLTVIVAKL